MFCYNNTSVCSGDVFLQHGATRLTYHNTPTTRLRVFRIHIRVFKTRFKYSLIIHEENTKKISTMSETLYVIKFCSKFWTTLIYKITAPLNLWNGSYLKPFKTLATRVLSGLKHCCSCFKLYLQHAKFSSALGLEIIHSLCFVWTIILFRGTLPSDRKVPS